MKWTKGKAEWWVKQLVNNKHPANYGASTAKKSTYEVGIFKLWPHTRELKNLKILITNYNPNPKNV